MFLLLTPHNIPLDFVLLDGNIAIQVVLQLTHGFLLQPLTFHEKIRRCQRKISLSFTELYWYRFLLPDFCFTVLNY